MRLRPLPLVFMLVSLTAIRARAEGSPDVARARCTASYVTAQEARRDNRYESAKENLLVCRETCSPTFASDCERWLRELEALEPRVRLFARSATNEALPFHATIDGRAVDAGGPIVVAPGTHLFRFESQGYDPVEIRRAVGQGEQEIDAVLVRRHLTESAAKSNVPSYVLGGVGAAALLAAGALTIKGHVDRSDLHECSPNCSTSRVDGIRTLWYTAGVLAAVGVVSVGVAALLYERPRKP